MKKHLLIFLILIISLTSFVNAMIIPPGDNGLVKNVIEPWCVFTFGANAFGQNESEGTVGMCLDPFTAQINITVFGNEWMKINSNGLQSNNFYSREGYYYFDNDSTSSSWIHQKDGYGDLVMDYTTLEDWTVSNKNVYTDVTLTSGHYLSTDGNEKIATDIIRHKLTNQDVYINAFLLTGTKQVLKRLQTLEQAK